eukprot:552911-Rhodomonas_salina.1
MPHRTTKPRGRAPARRFALSHVTLSHVSRRSHGHTSNIDTRQPCSVGASARAHLPVGAHFESHVPAVDRRPWERNTQDEMRPR